jgi:clan AA aspartic protease (TIGR02281 family)
MKANIIILISIIIGSTSSFYGQQEDMKNYNGVNYHLFSIPISKKNLDKISIEGNNGRVNTAQFLSDFASNSSKSFFACNASIENSNYDPMGLCVSNGKKRHDINLTDGSGNFFLKPNGVLWCDGSQVAIVSSDNYQNSSSVEWAIQSGPLLLENDQFHPLFDPYSSNVRHRVGVGICDATQELIFAISESEINFYTFADFFQSGLGCANALCLESGRPFVHMPTGSVVNPYPDLIGNILIFNEDPISNAKHPGPGPKPVPPTPPKPRYEIDMVKSPSGIYEIPAEINGSYKVNFIFDTGASDVSITPDVAMALFRNGTIRKTDYISTQTYTFADGSTADADVFNLREIKIGSMRFTNVKAAISNSIAAPMLLGQSVIQRIGKYTIDNTNHQLLIY